MKPLSGFITGSVGLAVPGPVLTYTDGSVRGTGRRAWSTGWGFVATDGRYGCGSYPQRGTQAGTDRAVVAELRAIWNAIGGSDEPATIVTDSHYAVRVMGRWTSGSKSMPAGYRGSGIGTPTLERLRRHVRHNRDRITVWHVRGHNGDPLNEAADALAGLGSRWGPDGLSRAEVASRAVGIVEAFMRDAGAR